MLRNMKSWLGDLGTWALMVAVRLELGLGLLGTY